MNELEALNMLLRLVGSSPVNSLETPHPDAVNARATLLRVSQQEQRRGWWFNIEYNVMFTPDTSKHIRIPSTVTKTVFEDSNLVQRGGRLFDKYNNTYRFESDQCAYSIVRILEWDDMADTMQEYCAYLAGAQFVRDELEDPQKESSLMESARPMGIAVKKQDLEEGQYNIYQQRRVQTARLGVRPYARNNQRFFGDR